MGDWSKSQYPESHVSGWKIVGIIQIYIYIFIYGGFHKWGIPP
jgi:uncharacterized protein involved in tellurium resistance